MGAQLKEYQRIIFVERPRGTPDLNKTWKTVTVPLPEPSEIPEGSVLVKVELLSVDPAMIGWMSEVRSYIPPIALGDVMRSQGLGTVVASKNQRFSVGDHVKGWTGWQEYRVYEEKDLKDITKVPALPKGVPLSAALGVLGPTGLTAYFGLLDVGKPKAGETVVVSGAAGATGSVVCQIAKLVGCRVVAIAGNPDKCRWLENECGVDVALNYRDKDFGSKLKEATPKFIDVYFDNVGGEILDRCLHRLNFKGRIVLCGAISQYTSTAPVGPKNYTHLIGQRGRMEGFIVMDYARQFGDAIGEMAKWVAEGKLKNVEEVVEGGVSSAPHALLKLFKGENTGKLLCKL